MDTSDIPIYLAPYTLILRAEIDFLPYFLLQQALLGGRRGGKGEHAEVIEGRSKWSDWEMWGRRLYQVSHIGGGFEQKSDIRNSGLLSFP